MEHNGLGRGSKIQSVERAVEILGYFRVSRPHLTLQEITARAGLTRATAHRYVSVLRDLNLLRYDPGLGSYSLGSRVMTMAAAATAANPMIRIVGPYMESLVRLTNETVVLTVWDGSAPVVLRVDDNTDRLVRVSIQTGVRLPTWESANGRVFCAFLEEEYVPRLPSGADRAKILADIDETRRTRIAINTNEAEGTRTIAAPIFANSRITASLAVVGTAASIPAERGSVLAKSLLSAVTRLSTEID
jgi:DNA-binding IclR family transcriptional regulator